MSQVSLEGSTRELVTSAYRKKQQQQQQAKNMYTINFSIKGFILNMKINKFHFFFHLYKLLLFPFQDPHDLCTTTAQELTDSCP